MSSGRPVLVHIHAEIPGFAERSLMHSSFVMKHVSARCGSVGYLGLFVTLIPSKSIQYM